MHIGIPVAAVLIIAAVVIFFAVSSMRNPPQEPYIPDPTTATEPTAPTKTPTEPEQDFSFDEYYEINSDFIGRITVPGTDVNHPVLQEPAGRPDFYLNRDIHKNSCESGVPFTWALTDTPIKDKNLFIYGHSFTQTAPEDMVFSSLLNFKDADFFAQNSIIIFNTRDEKRIYEILWVYEVAVTEVENSVTGASEFFNFYLNPGRRTVSEDYMTTYRVRNWDNPRQFEQYVNTSRRYAIHSADAEVSFGDRTVALVTCTTHPTANTRLVIVARQVEGG
jgi:sortase B